MHAGAKLILRHLYQHRILAYAFYTLPRNDKALLTAKAEKSGLTRHDERAYPAVARIEFNVAFSELLQGSP